MILAIMGKEFSTLPQTVPHVETKHRRICTPVPHPESTPLLDRMREVEPLSMRGMPPIIWEKAEDIYVFDKHGNKWLDWSSGVLVTNAGHAAPEICRAMIDQINSGLIHNYVFPSEERLETEEIIASVSPEGLKKVFLLSSGSEATECAIKLSRAHGIKVGGTSKIGIIGFDRGYHGRTLASQQAGGMAGQKSWIVNLDQAIINAPFPDGYWEGDSSFDGFLKAIENRRMKPENIAGAIRVSVLTSRLSNTSRNSASGAMNIKWCSLLTKCSRVSAARASSGPSSTTVSRQTSSAAARVSAPACP
jgi:4-aminobutyrate aminotransferase-like enzyme